MKTLIALETYFVCKHRFSENQQSTLVSACNSNTINNVISYVSSCHLYVHARNGHKNSTCMIVFVCETCTAVHVSMGMLVLWLCMATLYIQQLYTYSILEKAVGGFYTCRVGHVLLQQ